MTNELTENRLHQHMAQLVALEGGIEKTLEQQSKVRCLTARELLKIPTE